MSTHTGLTSPELKTALQTALPNESTAQIEVMTEAIMAVLSQNSAPKSLLDSQHTNELLNQLAGRILTTPQAVLSFGENNTAGNITVGDVAAGNITKIQINIQPQSTTVSQIERTADQDTQHRLKLIEIHTRRVRILEQQAAYFGVMCPPHITLEIDDTHKKIRALLGTA